VEHVQLGHYLFGKKSGDLVDVLLFVATVFLVLSFHSSNMHMPAASSTMPRIPFGCMLRTHDTMNNWRKKQSEEDALS
jgi:hypothetical protein